jgi:hypothetical protein
MMLDLLGQIPLLIVSDTSLLGQKRGTTSTGIGLILDDAGFAWSDPSSYSI